MWYVTFTVVVRQETGQFKLNLRELALFKLNYHISRYNFLMNYW